MFYFLSSLTDTFGNCSSVQLSISMTSKEGKVKQIADGTTFIIRDGPSLFCPKLGRTLQFHVHSKISYSANACTEFCLSDDSVETGSTNLF